MLNSVTQGCPRLSIILFATVVFPEALPPQIPKFSSLSGLIFPWIQFEIKYYLPMTKGSTCCPEKLYQGGRPAV